MLTDAKASRSERDLRGALAAAVWVESIACGSALAATGAVAVVGIGLFFGGFSLSPALAVIVIAVALAGGAFGFAVGVLVGLALGLLVTFTHGRLRVRTVATLMPLTATVVSQLCTFALFSSSRSPFLAAMAVLDALLTLPGALWIAKRYRLRTEGRRVH